jgi:hypothetical protein
MPINEPENHPYLNNQINDLADKSKLSKYTKLIVGTFPVYAVTESIPIEEIGLIKRENWQDDAFFKYFYGSRGSHFWDLFSSSFNEAMPGTTEEAIVLLDAKKFLITDVFRLASRNGYSPLDEDLNNVEKNEGLRDILLNGENIDIVYFTSKTAKRIFMEIFNIVDDDINILDNVKIIENKQYRLIVLISPAGNGRTVRHFFNSFPLNIDEANLFNNNQRYALRYRQRYYRYYLTLPV